ncbi:MAG: DUF5681 domain-containing protein [Burkholderiales bacterium]|nr:DUF5681 domain-containing protein [Burkholderiales bacterium]
MPNKTSGRWRPGQSGNPAGRRPGSGSVQQLRQAIENSLPEIIQCLADKAKAGDVGAARLLLERAIPALKPLEVPQTLQIDGEDLSTKAKSIFALAAAGKVSLPHSAQIIASLGTVAKLIEVDTIERRIQFLESSLEAMSHQKA